MAEPDPALLRQIQAEAGVTTQPVVSPLEYLRFLQERLLAWLDRSLGGLGGGPVDEALLWALVIGLPLLLAAVALGLVLRRRRRPARPLLRPAPPPPVVADPQAELERALARGDARAALGALWITLGRALDGAGRGRWSADLTEREFVAAVAAADPSWPGLDELRAVSRAVVQGVYGPEPLPIEAVAALVPRAQALAARAAGEPP